MNRTRRYICGDIICVVHWLIPGNSARHSHSRPGSTRKPWLAECELDRALFQGYRLPRGVTPPTFRVLHWHGALTYARLHAAESLFGIDADETYLPPLFTYLLTLLPPPDILPPSVLLLAVLDPQTKTDLNSTSTNMASPTNFSLRSIFSFAGGLWSQIPLLGQTPTPSNSESYDTTISKAYTPFANAPSCPSDSPLSCHNSTVAPDSCCFIYPGGQLLQTQFWDADPAVGPADSWTLHGLWYFFLFSKCETRAHKVKQARSLRWHLPHVLQAGPDVL